MRFPSTYRTQDADARGLIPLLALFAGAAALAYGGIFVRQSELEPTASAFWRIAIAIPILALLVQSFHRDADAGVPAEAPGTRGQRITRLVLVGMIFSGNLTLWHWSLTMTKLANANLLANFAPLVVIGGARLFFGQRAGGHVLVGLVIALAGAALLVGGKLEFSRDHLIGDLLGLGTAVFYGAYLLAAGRVRASSGTFEVMLWSGVGSLVILLPLCLVMGEALLPSTLNGAMILAALAIVSHVGGQGLIAYALPHLPAAVSSVTLLIQPVLAALFAWGLLGEHLTPAETAGGLAVLAGILIARRRT